MVRKRFFERMLLFTGAAFASLSFVYGDFKENTSLDFHSQLYFTRPGSSYMDNDLVKDEGFSYSVDVLDKVFYNREPEKIVIMGFSGSGLKRGVSEISREESGEPRNYWIDNKCRVFDKYDMEIDSFILRSHHGRFGKDISGLLNEENMSIFDGENIFDLKSEGRGYFNYIKK